MMAEGSLPEWKQHILVELGHIFGSIYEYEQPGDVAARLEAIAHELRDGFTGDLIPVSSRPEINAIYQTGTEG